MTTQWKLTEEGSIELKDGNPVFLDSKGEERTVSVDRLTTLNAEAMVNRQAKEALEMKLKNYEGIDPSEARAALEAVKTMGKSDEKLETIKAEMLKQHETKMAEKDTAFKTLQSRFDDLLIQNAFSTSNFIKNNLAVPADMFQAAFKDNLKIVDGELIVVDKAGNRIPSKESYGEMASVEEGLRILAENHPSKDTILKADVPTGSGSTGSGNGTGKRTITRDELAALEPVKAAEAAKNMREGKLTLI